MAVVTMTVNGHVYRRAIEPRLLLSDFLRDELGLTGTHVGCEQGLCGACTVLIDGAAARSCLNLAVSLNGKDITTIEGIRKRPQFPAIAQSLSRHHGVQCGFCTPGIVASMISEEEATQEEMDDLLAGHLCRCTGYVGIREAWKDLIQKKAGE
ncbi:MAG: 4-hydroxybenzoyl-CoA reductase subunit gamma [Sulfobacillus benefaciens]|uniref:4-hydroxybenzoyl-CoA reductase subunit gamma n=1 Tax=Sulfobacillus benefaciens TaxID=453960 RepID=A0A2T2WS54_9FIRM|nr:MAG: 4-hydroxybenzoyl-CoA reductase subunit gamma [Sulfobacillus benefaciens]